MVAVLLRAGDHVPVMPSLEVRGSAFNVAPSQIGATALNVGVTLGLTVIVKVVVVAHCPAVGVKVYVVVAVLLIAGDHVPAMPSFEVDGSVMVDPLHTGPTASNVGVIAALTVTLIVAVVAQVDDVGVNV